jgi:hypothetical protein
MQRSLLHQFGETSHTIPPPANGRDLLLSLRIGRTTRQSLLMPSLSSACGLLSLGANDFNLIHYLNGIFACHAVGLKDGLDVVVDGLHLGRLNSSRVEDGCKARHQPIAILIWNRRLGEGG